jgi:hypothetical protein
VRLPTALADEGVLSGGSQIAAGRDEECAAAHRRIEHAEAQDLVGGSSGQQRRQRATHQVAGDRSRGIERPGRLACIAAADKSDPRVRQRRSIVEHPFVDGAELLDIEIPIGNPRAAAGPVDRRRSDGDDRASHHLVVDSGALE